MVTSIAILVLLLYWFLQMFFLGGLRVVYRYFHYARTLKRVKIADATPTLVLGRAADAEVLLRGIESGSRLFRPQFLSQADG